MNIIKLVSTLLFAVLLTACGAVNEFQVQSATSSYFEVAQVVNLGDSKDRVLNLLLPTQKDLNSTLRKPPEKHMNDDVLVEIYYMRTGWGSDGLTTDDEFTPYIFNNGQLVGIGWTTLGHPKSQEG